MLAEGLLPSFYGQISDGEAISPTLEHCILMKDTKEGITRSFFNEIEIEGVTAGFFLSLSHTTSSHPHPQAGGGSLR